jgi:Zn-dependent protease
VSSWTTIAILVGLVVFGLPRWVRFAGRRRLLNLPLYPVTYVEIPAADVPATIRDGLAVAFTELTPLGFEVLAYIGSPLFPGAPPRIVGVLRHATDHAIASVAFSIGAGFGATVDFDTTFEDGTWLRTVNRRGFYSRPSFPDGRQLDALAMTIAEQWQFHQRAVAAEPPRPARVLDLAEVARLRNERDAEESRLDLVDGHRHAEGDGSCRFTPAGADAFIARVQAGAAALAKLQPPWGALAMPLPADERERQYHDLKFIASKRPRLGTWKGFLLSAAAFAASAFLFPHWQFFLWLIPFLLLHELGHFAAMRAFGHKDATIRFVPFFGAATMTTTRFKKLSHEMIVLLAGPVPGLVLAFVIFQLTDFHSGGQLMSVAITLVTINGLNLLPVHPLDGGRVVHALLTAGRPRLDLALKGLAGAAFLAAALKYDDFTLVILGGGILLFFRSGVKQWRLERAIRARPDFAPGLSEPARRRLIFEAMKGHEPGDQNLWLAAVQELEVALSHEPRRWAVVLPWLAVYGAMLGTLVAWSVSVLSVTPVVGARCPERATAKPVACGGAEPALDWEHLPAGTKQRNPFKLVSGPSYSRYPTAAFVWCTGPQRVAGPVAGQLKDVEVASAFCPAPPWEAMPAQTKQQRDLARDTYTGLERADDDGEPIETRRELIKKFVDDADEHEALDAEMVRLYGAWIEQPRAEDVRRQLSERLGRSPTQSCDRVRVVGVTRANNGTWVKADNEAGGDLVGVSIRFSLLMSSPAELAPVRQYLCAAGCEVDVLPYGASDPRLRYCRPEPQHHERP